MSLYCESDTMLDIQCHGDVVEGSRWGDIQYTVFMLTTNSIAYYKLCNSSDYLLKVAGVIYLSTMIRQQSLHTILPLL